MEYLKFVPMKTHVYLNITFFFFFCYLFKGCEQFKHSFKCVRALVNATFHTLHLFLSHLNVSEANYSSDSTSDSSSDSSSDTSFSSSDTENQTWVDVSYSVLRLYSVLGHNTYPFRNFVLNGHLWQYNVESC